MRRHDPNRPLRIALLAVAFSACNRAPPTPQQTSAPPQDGSAAVAASIDAAPPGPPLDVLATAVRPVALALDATYVYWLQGAARALVGPDAGARRLGGFVNAVPRSPYLPGTGALMRAPKSGGAAVPIAHGSEVGGHFAVDGTNVYYLEKEKLISRPLDGGAAKTLSSQISNFVMGDDALFARQHWETVGELGAGGMIPVQSDGALLRVPKHGGAPARVGKRGAVNPECFVVDRDAVYSVVDNRSYQLVRHEIATGHDKALASGLSAAVIGGMDGACFELALDDTAVYWRSGGGFANTNEEISRVLKTGGETDVFARGLPGGPLVVDSKYVYAIDGSGRLVGLPKRGGPPVTVATEPDIGLIAADESGVYFTSGERVLRARP